MHFQQTQRLTWIRTSESTINSLLMSKKSISTGKRQNATKQYENVPLKQINFPCAAVTETFYMTSILVKVEWLFQ